MEPARGWETDAELLRALASRHILFLCVANSGRSQLAEGIARSSAPKDVKISSAGSVPTSVRPQAVEEACPVWLESARVLFAGQHP